MDNPPDMYHMMGLINQLNSLAVGKLNGSQQLNGYISQRVTDSPKICWTEKNYVCGFTWSYGTLQVVFAINLPHHRPSFEPYSGFAHSANLL